MKRLFAVICALMLLPTLANADNDMISVSELRKQVERMERWKQNYKDDYGRSIGVDVEPIMNKIEKVPILMMDSPVISEENVYNAFQQESVSVLENDVAIDYTCIDPETGGNVLISLVKEDNWLYPTPECGDIDLQISILDEKRDISSELVVLDGFFASPNEIDMNCSYLGEKSLTVNDGMELIERRMNELFPDYDLKFEFRRDSMDIQFMKDYYDLRYEETDGENHFVEETAYQEKQSEQSKMEDQLMEMVGGSESNVWKLYESIMCVYFDMEEIIKQAVYLQGAYDRERMLK